MENHLDGEAYEAHYEKELKDFTPVDWVTSIVYLLIILSAVVLGFLQNWGMMVIMIGVAVSMLHVFMRIVMKVNNRIVRYFFLLGVFIIIAGVITCTEHYEYLALYIIALYLLISFWVGILCLNLAKKKRKKIRSSTFNHPTDVLPKNEGTFIEMAMGIGWIAIAVIVAIVLGVCYYLGVF